MTMRGKSRAAALLALAAFLSCKSDAADPGAAFSVTPPTHTLDIGASVQLSAVNPPGAVTWSSNREDIATVVPQTGFVTAVGAGTARISAVSGTAVATAEITVRQPGLIVLSQTAVALETLQGAGPPTPVTVQITNGGESQLGTLNIGQIQYGQGQPEQWLQLALNSPTAPANLTVGADVSGLTPGTYTASVPITAPTAANSPQNLAVQLTIIPMTAVIALDPASVALNMPDGVQQVQHVVQITNAGPGSLTGLALGAIEYGPGATGWLQASLGATTAPTSLTVVAQRGALANGSYSATVPVISPVATNSPRNLQVTLDVGQPPVIDVTPTDVVFDSYIGSSPQFEPVWVLTVTNAGGGTLTDLEAEVDYIGSPPGEWIKTLWVTPTTAPAQLQLTGSTAGFTQAGIYQADLTIRGTGAQPVTIRVRMDLASFDTHVLPILHASCSGCHPTNEVDPTGAYNWAVGFISPGNPSSSELLCRINPPANPPANCAVMPPSPPRLSAAEIITIRNWILRGGPR